MSNKNQGEGDKESARHYNDAQHDFAQSGKVEQAARDAAPRDDADAKQMQQAEQVGKAHAKGEGDGATQQQTGKQQKAG